MSHQENIWKQTWVHNVLRIMSERILINLEERMVDKKNWNCNRRCLRVHISENFKNEKVHVKNFISETFREY